MRVCPTCGRRYGADVDFCVEDGAKLLDAAGVTAPPTRPDGATNPAYPPQNDPLPPGSQVGEYVVEKQIGSGGMGVIFAAVHPVIGKQAAIKLLHPMMAHNHEVVQRFVTEAKAVNQIRHRNIVDIFSFGTLPDGRHYFTMEMLEGESLAGRLEKAPLPPKQAFDVWLQTAAAVEAAHAHGIVHRDLKPDNIFLCPSEDGPFVKVLDFGIAKLLGDAQPGMTKTSTGVPMGTPLYMSPEQATGERDIDHRTDLYAFGVILYEMISGQPPHRGTTYIEVLSKKISAEHQKLSELVTIDPALEQLIDQLIEKDPAARPPNMGVVRGRLMELRDRLVAGDQLWGPADEALRRRAEKQAQRKQAAAAGPSSSRALVAGGLGLGVAAAVLAVALLARSRPPPPPAMVAAPPPVAAPPRPAPPVPTSGRVLVSTNAPKTQVYLDRKRPDGSVDKAAGPSAAGGQMLTLQVPADADWMLRVEGEGFQPSTQLIRVAAGEERALPIVLQPLAAPPSKDRASGRRPSRPEPSAQKAPLPPPNAAGNTNLMQPF